MKTSKLLILIVILAFSGFNFSKPKIIKPTNSRSQFVLIESGKKKIFFEIPQKDPSIISVKGPGKLKVTTRAQFLNDINKLSYIVYYNIDGNEYVKANFNDVMGSNKIKFEDNKNGNPGLAKDIEIELGPGEHNLNFRRQDDKPLIVARYVFSKIKEKKLKWVMLSPSRPKEPVDLVTHENAVHYYRFSKDKPLKMKINGPSILRVLTRFENHYDMKGTINYRLQLKENGNVIHTYLLNSTFSDVTSYKDNNKLIPGKAKEFYIEVPKGKHTYIITPLDKDKNTILARVLFPKKDVKLE